MVIHTFGDSHCSSCWPAIDNVITHHLGPKLCFSIGRDGINIKDGYGINDGDIVVFCTGEIDCRCHVHKHISNEQDYKMIIDSIINNYFKQINIAVSAFRNIRTAVYNVVPPVERANFVEDPGWPLLGSDEERKSYVLYFNQQLKMKCLENNYIFIDIYDKYTNSKGFMDPALSHSSVHITEPKYLKEFVENNLQK